MPMSKTGKLIDALRIPHPWHRKSVIYMRAKEMSKTTRRNAVKLVLAKRAERLKRLEDLNAPAVILGNAGTWGDEILKVIAKVNKET